MRFGSKRRTTVLLGYDVQTNRTCGAARGSVTGPLIFNLNILNTQKIIGCCLFPVSKIEEDVRGENQERPRLIPQLSFFENQIPSLESLNKF